MRHGQRDDRLDSPLVNYKPRDLEGSAPEIWSTIRMLVNQSFDQIITSPYLRARQTAELVQYGLLKLTNRYIPIKVDVALGEYMQRRCSWNVPELNEFDKKTAEHYNGRIPLCRESRDAFILRVKRFYDMIEPNTLLVTHNGVAGLLGYFAQQSVELSMGGYRVLSSLHSETLT